jgi:hypothetical protein
MCEKNRDYYSMTTAMRVKNYVKRDGYRAGIINTYSGGTQVYRVIAMVPCSYYFYLVSVWKLDRLMEKNEGDALKNRHNFREKPTW